ncbi:uncharacterized protein N0V89_010940 [Didymosphaeria variabile]|uniref:Uncharacterized protein n=1 Tax=Didymosphaeria variabile TaxID=1932322 RepID=A0A9W8XC65_9PLEO|nr:uncharacterized protein N0V89_010940 [Didymosphaeria variabile]KAJ4347006.1 hypothetical protein N0V89_010940 [Didymosphaeria variabile]
MKSFAIAAFVAVAAAAPQYEVAPPAYNTSSAVETPAYSTPVAIPSYSAASSSSVEYSATTVECSGPTEVPVGPSYTFTYTGSETTTLTFSYPVSAPAGEYTPAPVAPSAPAYPTSNGTVPSAPSASYPAGTAPGAPSATGSYAVPSPSAPATEFPGAAGKTGLSMLAVAGALAAFL